MSRSLAISVGLITISLASCVQPSTEQTRPPVLYMARDTCDDPDAHVNCCFVGMPADLSSIMTIARQDEPGDRVVITGTVFRSDSTPYAGVLLYAYHTDNNGYYKQAGGESGFQRWHGRLHGWCETDVNGRYEIRTIRPGRYPVNLFPAHIHAAMKKPDGSASFYISDFVFSDDSLVNEEYLSGLKNMVGGSGVVELQRLDTGWMGNRDIVLE